jgi:hypothetical protein
VTQMCPKCGSSDVRRSGRMKWMDLAERLRNRVPYRCRACRLRFFASRVPGIEQNRARTASVHRKTAAHVHRKGHIQRRLIEGTIFVTMLAIFLAFLRYLTMEPIIQPANGFN